MDRVQAAQKGWETRRRHARERHEEWRRQDPTGALLEDVLIRRESAILDQIFEALPVAKRLRPTPGV
jgi:hypothetical protein